jgi:hypothetical protein
MQTCYVSSRPRRVRAHRRGTLVRWSTGRSCFERPRASACSGSFWYLGQWLPPARRSAASTSSTPAPMAAGPSLSRPRYRAICSRSQAATPRWGGTPRAAATTAPPSMKPRRTTWRTSATRTLPPRTTQARPTGPPAPSLRAPPVRPAARRAAPRGAPGRVAVVRPAVLRGAPRRAAPRVAAATRVVRPPAAIRRVRVPGRVAARRAAPSASSLFVFEARLLRRVRTSGDFGGALRAKPGASCVGTCFRQGQSAE